MRSRAPRLYAHRGAAAEEPENTLESFERATSYGVDALEMDLHRTLDGKIVVSHDPDGERCCGVAKMIRDTHWSEVRKWDAGRSLVDAGGQRDFRGRGYRIPRLEEILEAFPDHLINLDLKQKKPSMVGALMRILREARAEERVILASFSQATLLHLRTAGYRGPTASGPFELAVALYGSPALTRRLPLRGHAAQIPERHGRFELATRDAIDKLHACGLRVDFWTINDPERARELIELGADGIMTDDPKRLAPIFETASQG